jgi:hypothetical protein
MKNQLLLYISIGVAVGLGLFLFGYSLGFASEVWGFSETLVGAVVGGLIAMFSGYIAAAMSHHSQLASLEHADVLGRNRKRENRESEAAKDVVGQLDSWYVEIANAQRDVLMIPVHADWQNPNLDRADEALVRLRTKVSTSFPELDEFLAALRMEFLRSGGLTFQAAREARNGNHSTAEDMHEIWKTAESMQNAMRKYLVEKYIHRREAEAPTESRIRLLLAMVDVARKAREEQDAG